MEREFVPPSSLSLLLTDELSPVSLLSLLPVPMKRLNSSNNMARKVSTSTLFSLVSFDCLGRLVTNLNSGRPLRAEKPIISKTENFADEVLKLTDNKGVDVLIDFIGASYWEKNLKSLGRDGRMVLLGLMGGAKTETPMDLSQILFKRLRIEGTTLRSRTLEYQGKLLQDFSKEALGKVFAKAKGEEGLDLVIHKVSANLSRSVLFMNRAHKVLSTRRYTTGRISKKLTKKWNRRRILERSFAKSSK